METCILNEICLQDDLSFVINILLDDIKEHFHDHCQPSSIVSDKGWLSYSFASISINKSQIKK